MKKLLQSFCLILSCITALSLNAQVEFSISKTVNTYQVKMRPTVNYSGTAANTLSGQVTLVAPTGSFTPTLASLQSQFGSWTYVNQITRSPQENPGFDYISFYMPSPVSTASYVAGVEQNLFSFEATGTCNGTIQVINNNTDPFFPRFGNNSQSVNVGNQIAISGNGNLNNAWSGNYGSGAACPSNNVACGIKYQLIKIGSNTYQVNMIPNVTYSGSGNTTSTQQVTLKVPSGLVYTNFSSMTSGANFAQGSRVNAPSQAPSNDYLMFNLSSLGTTAMTYTSGVSVPLFKFDVPGTCSGSLSLMDNTDPFAANTSYNSKQQLTVSGYNAPDIPICFEGSGAASCPITTACQVEYEIETLANGTFQVSMIPKVTYTGSGNTTSTQQVSIKVPTGFQYRNLTNLIGGVTYAQGSRINAPSQAPSSDYILFNLSSLGTTNITYTNGVKVPLFTFEKSGACSGSLALMPDNDPFVANTSYNSKQQLTVNGYGVSDIPLCIKGSGTAACPPAAACQVEYQIERLSNGKFQVSIIPNVTYTGTGNTTSNQQVTVKVPTGFQYSNLASLISGVTYTQGSRVNAPSQATANDYIMFNLTSAGTTNITYTSGVKVPLFTFEKVGVCSGTIALMQNNDPFAANLSYNSKQQLTVSGYGQPDIPLCINGTGIVPCAETCVIKYQLETVNGCDYQVSMIPDTTWASPYNITKTAKVTLRVPHGCFTVADLTSLNFGANFTVAQVITSPPDNPAYDYICFNMTTVPTVALPYVKGQKVPLFTFKNSGACCGSIELMPADDPFAHGNTLNQNLDQHWTTSGSGASGVEPCIVGSPLPCVSNNVANILGADKTICQGETAQLSVTGAYASYAWSPAATLSATNIANPIATPAITTTYSVTATTAGGCPIKDEIVVNVTATPNITSVSSANSTNCASANGSITINATATGTIEYSINGGGSWTTVNTFNNLTAGSYTVMTRIQNTTCTKAYAQNPVVITATGAPTITSVVASNPTDCNVNNGQLVIAVSGTSGPYKYSINNGVSYQISPLFANLPAGTYNIKVSDASNTCAVTYPSVTLVAPVAPTNVTATVTAITDCDLANGTISVSANGGIAPLQYSIDGGVNWQTSTVFANLPQGSYNVSVRNATGSCVTNIPTPVVVTMPAMASFSLVTGVQPTTCGGTNGSIAITATGGAASLEYSIDNGVNWQSSSTFNNLPSGTYYVKIRNSGGTCAKSFPGNPLVLNAAAAPAIVSVIKTVTSDCALNDGSIVINASGSGLLEYSINGGSSYQTTNTYIGLAAGSYDIRVRVQGGNAACTTSMPACIIPTKNAPSLVAAVVSPVTDCAKTDGTISITANGGIAPLQYSINGTSWQLSNVFPSVAAGTYTVYVRNADGSCKQTSATTYAVTQPTAPTNISAIGSTATCGQNNGIITISASGGTGPLQYSINNIAWQSGNTFNNIPSGYYAVYVRNANGSCVTQAQNWVVVNQTTGPVMSNITISNLTDCSVNNGTISITAAGGAAPLQYSINGGVTFQSSSSFASLAAGTYNVVVRNADGTCPGIASPVTLTQPTAANIITSIASNPQGCGYNNGTITVLAYGGIAPLEYSLDGITWQASSTFLYLPAGSYTPRVRNANGTCVKISSTVVTLTNTATAPSITNVTKTNPASCIAADGSITITASPNTNVEYSINNIHWQTANTFNNLIAGTYVAYVRNANGTCATPYGGNPITLSPSAASHSITNVAAVNPTCGNINGSITITATPSANLMYSINGGTPQASNIFANIPTGTYNIFVSNSITGCSVSYPAVTLTAPSAPVITSVTPKNPATCNSNDGEISITATGGLPALQYSIDGTQWQVSSTFNGLSANTYTVYVRNADNTCQVQGVVPIVLTAPSAPSTSNVVAVQPTTCSATDGTITITATGGTGNYEYKITGKNWQASNVFAGLASGSYIVEVRITGSNCVGGSAQNPIVLTGTVAHSVSAVYTTNPICGSNNGQLQVVVAGAGGPFQYSLNGGAYQYSPYFAGLAAGTYVVTVRDASGVCSVNSPTTTLTAPTAPSILAVTPTVTSDCGTADGQINITATNGVAPLEYSIDGTNWQISNIFTNLVANSYTIRVRNADNTCMVTAGSPITVGMPPMPSITNVIMTNPTACGTSNATISVVGTGGQGALEYSIDNGLTWQTGGTFAGLASGTYFVMIRNQDNTCGKAYPGNPVVINAGQAPTIVTIIKTKPTTCGGNDGKIEITAQGTSGLEYSINNGINFQASNTFTGLAAGTFNVVVRYANATNCTSSVPNCVIPASSPASISSVNATSTSDCGQADGTITVSAGGGIAPLQYSINNGTSYQLSNIFVGVAAGSYTIKVRNADGSCEVTHNVAINVTSPISPTLVSVTPTIASCGVHNGSITIAATGGIAPLQYSINGISWQASNVFNGLQAGSYNVFVRNSTGSCRVASNNLVVVSQTTGPNTSAVTINHVTNCTTPNGSLTITASGGTAPYQYSIDGGVNFQASNTFAGLAAGTYNIVVRNADGTCPSIVTPITIIAPVTPVIVSTTATNPSDCNNGGTISVAANGANLEYSINGTTWQASNVFTNVAPGTYTVQARNAANTTCAATSPTQVTIAAPAPPVVSNVISTGPASCGFSNGTITITSTPSTGVQYSLDNIHWQNNGSFTNLAAGTYNIRIRFGTGYCNTTYNLNPLTLAAQNGPQVAATQAINPTDCNLNNGSVTIYMSGGTAPYQYSKDNGVTYQYSNVFANLAAGTYAILIKDASGVCQTNTTATLTAPTAPATPTAVATAATSCTLPSGSINVTAPTGASYEYSINNGVTWQASPTFSGLAVGTYVVQVRKIGTTCKSNSAAVTITAPTLPVIETVDAIFSITGCTIDGSIFIDISNAGSWEYSIDGGFTWSSNNQFNNLTQGTYIVMARPTGKADCAQYYAGNPIIMTAPNAPKILDVSVNQPTTCNGSDGVITINAQGATEYSIDNGVTYQASHIFTGLGVGTYRIKVKEASGCEAIASPVVMYGSANLPTVLTAVSSPRTDCNANNGAITVTGITGPNAPYELSLDGITWQTSNVFAGLNTGNYLLRARNNGSACMFTSPTSLDITSPNAPVFNNVTSTQASCGTNDGTITISASTGALYSIDGVNYQNTGNFTNVAPGSYTVFIKNANGTCATAYPLNPVVISAPPGVAITAVNAVHPNACAATNGSITITATSGIAPYEYSINGGLAFQTSNAFANLAAGAYNIVVRGSGASALCPVTYSQVILVMPASPSISTVVAYNPTAACKADGTITVIAINGNNPLEYSLDGTTWQASNYFAGLTAGTYTVRIRNANGTCTVVSPNTVTLTAPVAPSVTSVASTNPTNCITLNGSITITASPNTGVQYSINGTTWQNSNTFNNLPTGAYTVYVRNANGTCATAYANNPVQLISAGSPVIVNVDKTNMTDCNKNDGTITIEVTNNGVQFKYSIDNGASYQLSNYFVGLSAGTYQVKVSDLAGNCPATFPNVTITSPTGASIVSVSTIPTTNCGTNTGSISITASPNTGVQYSIDNGANWTSSNVFANLPAGSYIIKVRNTNGTCEVTNAAPAVIAEPAKPTITNVTHVNPTLCVLSDGSITITATGGTGSFEYSINGTTWQASNTFANLVAGSYTVFARNAGTTCIEQYAQLAILSAPTAPSINGVTSINPVTCLGSDGSITITAFGAGTLEYSINGGTTYQVSNVFNGLGSGTYNIRVRQQGLTCSITYPAVSLVAPQAATIIAVTPTATTDCSVNDGKITISATNAANTAMEYSVDGINWYNNSTIMYLAAGSYTVRVRIVGTNCIATAATPVTITSPTTNLAITNVVKVNPTVCGSNDGSITIIASGGIPTIQYSIDNINWQNSNQFINLPAGTYFAYTRNNGGLCKVAYANNPVIITPGVNSPIIVSATKTNVTNCGVTDGSLTINTSGGIAPLQYSIDGGRTWSANASYTGLPAGFYDIVVRNNDQTCATILTPVQITAPTAPSLVDAILTKPVDCANPSAKITVLASSGQPPLQYSIDNKATWSTSNIFPNLGIGYYHVWVRNADGTCPTPSISNPIVSCEFDLALRKKLSSNQAPVVRLGSDVNFDIKVFNQGILTAKDIEVVDYLPLGTILSPNDANGWTYIDAAGNLLSANLLDPSKTLKVKKTIAGPIVSKDSATLQIKLRVIYGGPNATLVNVAEIAGSKDLAGVSRQDGDSSPDSQKGNDKQQDNVIDDKNVNDEDDEDPAPIKLDDYDPHGYIYCDKEGTLLKGGKVVLLTAPPGGSIYFVNDANGVLQDGTHGVYQFFTNGIPGNYTMGYTHPGGYTMSTTILPNVGPFNPAGTDGTAIDRDGLTNNVVQLGQNTANGGLISITPSDNPYYLSFTFNPNETTIIANNNLPVSCACINSVVCEDVNGNGVAEPTEPGINGVTVEIYNCVSNLKVDQAVTANGGKYKITGLLAGSYKLKFLLPAGYSYVQNGTPVAVNNSGETACFPLGYNGCEDKPVCLKVCPTLTISPNVTVCAGSSATLTVAGGSTYTWTGAGLNTNTGATVIATPNVTTVYTVSSTNGGCTSVANVTVTVAPTPANNFSVSSINPTSCANSNGQINITASPNVGLEYSVDNGNNWGTNNVFSGLASGAYTVRIRNAGSACSTPAINNPIQLNAPSTPTITSVTSVHPTNCTTPNGTITVVATGGTGSYQYSSDNGANWQLSNQFLSLAAGTYNIKVRNSNGQCEVTYPAITLTTNLPVINTVNVVSDCANNNRSITILASGGQGPLEYSINNGASWTTNNTFTGLAAGYYTVKVRNFNGTCEVSYVNGPIAICAFDLALEKKLAPGQTNIVRLGDVIQYQVIVTNQGAINATNIQVVDYIPTGMQLSPAGNNGWTAVGTDMATNTVASLAAGASVTLNLSMQLVYGSPNASLKNVAEIKDAKDGNGNPVTDIDSTPDMVKGNDTEKDGVTNEDGKNGGDEDDSDPENITLDNFDPSGYIYCEKTGKVITGGKMKLVQAPTGGEIFFTTDNSGKLLDGSTGMYQIFTNGVAGVYTFTYEHPNNYPLSTTCLPQAGPFNPAGKDGNPTFDKDGIANGTIHLGSLATNNYLADKSCSANKYYLSFELNKDEKTLIATNNIPVSCAVITGKICNDTNGDGLPQTSEPGIAGMKVLLFDCASTTGVAIANTTTDTYGKYVFDGLKGGNYKVQLVTAAGQIVKGGTFNTSGVTACKDVKFGECVELNACISACPTINNVLVVRPACPKNNGVIIIDAVCQGDLEYSIDNGATYQHLNAFLNLAPGTYRIKVKSLGCEQEYKDVIVLDCDTNTGGGGKGSISGKAFKDCTGNGYKGTNKGAANVKVTLTGTSTQTTTTDANGRYNFANIDAGSYIVTFEKPTGMEFAKQNQGSDDNNDSDVSANGISDNINVAANQLVDNIDAGLKDVQGPTINFTHPWLVGKKDGETIYMECAKEYFFSAKDATLTDNCDNAPTVKFGEDAAIFAKDCEKEGFLVKMHCGWIATDACGNKSQIWFNFIVRDTGIPELVGVPADMTVAALSAVPAAANVKGTDMCDKTVTVLFDESQNGNIVTRTWTAIDDCGNKTSSKQVITIKTGGGGNCTIANLPVAITSPAGCNLKNGKAKMAPNNFTFKWSDGSDADVRLDLGAGTYIVTVTDAQGCTGEVAVKILDGCGQKILALTQSLDVKQVACNTTDYGYCLDLDLKDIYLGGYELRDNGTPLAGIKPCEVRRHHEYVMNGVENYKNVTLEEWTIAGKKYEGVFNSLAELRDMMNTWDSGTTWILDNVTSSIQALNPTKAQYGTMKVKMTDGSNLSWNFNVNEYTSAHGATLSFDMGLHQIELVHKATNYRDTTTLNLVCTTTETINLDLEEGDEMEIDLATKELVGTKCAIKVMDADPNNPVADFHGMAKKESMIMVEAMEKGWESRSYTMCDEYNVCDTTKLKVQVREKIKVKEPVDSTIVIYNAFSPNDDGNNDVFYIKNIEFFPNSTLSIYNRWGNEVFTTEAYQNDWTGTFGSNKLPDGTYYFVLEVKGKKTRSGYVELRR